MTKEYIRNLRLNNYLTQTGFAKRVGVHINTIINWEKGTHKVSLTHQHMIVNLIKQGELKDV